MRGLAGSGAAKVRHLFGCARILREKCGNGGGFNGCWVFRDAKCAYDYVKEFGEGVDRMCRELSAIGTKEPQYHLVAFIMKATVWANVLEEGQEKTISDQKRPESDQISDQIKMILELIKENPQIGRSEISHKMGLHESSVKRRLKMLVDKGVIQRIGSDKGGYWQLLK